MDAPTVKVVAHNGVRRVLNYGPELLLPLLKQFVRSPALLYLTIKF